MAYFSTWWPHENRVSKTQFINLIKVKEEPRRTQRKKKSLETEREEPRSCTVRDPGQAARCVVTQADRSRFFSLSLFFFFFFSGFFSDMFWASCLSYLIWVSRFIVLWLGILSPSDLIVLGLRMLYFWIS